MSCVPQKQKGRRSEKRRLFGVVVRLKIETQAKLHAAWIVSGAQVHEVTARQKRRVDAATCPRPIATVLRVVEEVEGFRAELETSPLVR